MISSIFYFADTEQEYLDNFNRHQVKPYTIVFCRDTRSLWKNGVRYGGSTASEVSDSIQSAVDQNIAPLLEQLDQAIDQANAAIDSAEDRITAASQNMDLAIANLNADIDAEKTRLNDKVGEINDKIEEEVGKILDDYQDLVDNFEDNVTAKVESLLDDAEWVQENMPQKEVTWDSNWDQNVDNRMLQAGYWDIDPETGEKTTKWSKLLQSVDHIGTEVARVDESLSGDISAVRTEVQQTADSITSVASRVSNVDGRLSDAETSISQTPDAIRSEAAKVTKDLNGNIATAKSEVIQKASEIVQTVTGVTVASDGTVNTSNTNLSQQIADNGDAITQLRTDWSNANLDTKDVLEWMYSGLTTKAGETGTFNDLVSAASSGDHSAISNILSLVEKIPVQKVDPQSGEPLEDEHGNPIYETDSNGNIIYQTNPDGSYKYKAKASLTSAVDDALSGLITSATSDKAGAELISSLDNQVAALSLLVGDGESSLEGIVTTDTFASELKAVAAEDWAETALTSKLRVPKYDDNGDPMLDGEGNPVYEDVSDVLGSMRTSIDTLKGGPLVTNSIDAKVRDALSTFEQSVTGQSAQTTVVNKLGPALSGLVSKVTGDTSSSNMLSKINNMTAGVVTTANLESAVAGLIARQDAIITLTISGPGLPPSGTLNMGPSGPASLPSSITNLITGPGTVLTLSATDFNTAFQSQGICYTTISTLGGDQQTFIPIKYVAGKTGVQSGPYYAISDGQYLFISSGLIIKIGIRDLSGAVFSRVDNKLNTATAGLAARDYVNGKEASILASIANGTAEITLKGDKVNFDADFIDAVKSDMQVNTLIANAVDAIDITAETIDATSGSSHTIVDGNGIRVYSGEGTHEYDQEYDEAETYSGYGEYYPNILIHKSGEGWLANGHISWNGNGDTYIGPGSLEDGDDGIYVYRENDSTKIKLQGEIIANNFSLLSKQNQNQNGYFVNSGTYIGALYNNGFYVRLATDDDDYHYSRDLNNGVVPETDTNNPWTTVDWGTIAIGSKNGTLPEPRGNNPVNKNNKDTYNQTLSPGVTLSVKGRDGYAYIGFTGIHNGMNYINGIAVGPSDSKDTLFDKTFN